MSNTTDHVPMEIGEADNGNVFEAALDKSVAPLAADRVKLEEQNEDEVELPSVYVQHSGDTIRRPDGYSMTPSAEALSDQENIDFGSDVGSDSSYRSQSTKYNLSTVKQIFIYKERSADINTEEHRKKIADSDPPVLWTARIYNSNKSTRKDIDPSVPEAIYLDDRPLELRAHDVKRPYASDEVKPPAESGSERGPRWYGPVIEVEVSAQAQLLGRSWKRSSKSDDKLRNRQIPNCPSSLKIERVSRPRIIIKSSLVLGTLNRLIGYYPSFQNPPPVPKAAGIDPEYPEIMTYEYPIYEPYAVLMHHFSDIRSFVDTNTDEESRLLNRAAGTSHDKELLQLEKSHMRHVLDFLRPLHTASVLQCESYLSEPSPRISFDMLWYLYRPGIDVYMRVGDIMESWVVTSVQSNLNYEAFPGWNATTYELRYWNLVLWCLDTDGTRISRKSNKHAIFAYSGLCEVIGLEVCPATIWDASDGGERRQDILKRSRVHVKALNQGYLLAQYNGPGRQGNRYYNGSVVIDHRRGLVHDIHDPPIIDQVKDNSDHFRDYDNIRINEKKKDAEAWLSNEKAYSPQSSEANRRRESWSNHASLGELTDQTREFKETIDEPPHVFAPVQSELSDHQLLLLYPTTRCFALKTKQWMTIFTDYISEISPSEESLQNLVFGENELKTIRALSNRQNSRNETWAADFIEGKGLGQIILLHGPPGVGKTYTVEAIAEWLHRPLLALTVADIGTAETRIEGELVKWFALAEAWNAVLLVDEADIFLERRQNRDLARNGLVSAFLRRMEYFQGLLFLTTNRVGQIDDAFISRVHVAIGYKSLTSEDRKRIWNGFFKKLVKERAGKIQIAADAKKWVLENAGTGEAAFNGRDIRNALQTAITLAESDCEEDPDFDSSKETIVVLKHHFQRVLEISNKFHEYVASIRRQDEKARAAGREDRNDYGD